ncbi:Bestrophin, RFP-TM, chloride channel-domain-containing protein [Auriculariales sp. MPI-PUGE-AT-0066]|nr:Bestrophin, RFP-TM, chloride channel-domain-containing protein [Auriculariales sp. MPI-PUGE-AT-0066]
MFPILNSKIAFCLPPFVRMAPPQNTPRHLLPAANTHGVQVFVPVVPSIEIPAWTFGRGTVLWRIYPAIIVHTLFASIVYAVHTQYEILIPARRSSGDSYNSSGVVIGFVLSYRASSGYDRYWMGRGAWGDLLRHCRTLSRLTWYHVPLRSSLQGEPTDEDQRQIMREKRMVIRMIQAFAVATKHHLRGEMTIFYEDLYPLVQPLHNHPRREGAPAQDDDEPTKRPSLLSRIGSVFKRQSTSDNSRPAVLTASPSASTSALPPQSGSHVAIQVESPQPTSSRGNGYGTFKVDSVPGSPATAKPHLHPTASEDSLFSTTTASSDEDDEHRPLLPASLNPADRNKLPQIKTELVAFSSFVNMLTPNGQAQHPHPGAASGSAPPTPVTAIPGLDFTEEDTYVQHTDRKHRPKIPGGGENIPLQILWVIDDWFSLCEKRGTVPGTSLGTMIGTLGAVEDSLGQLEKILMTPLPFVYSVHIRHILWIYMFCLPFQLVAPFGVWSIPGVAIAAFFFLGLLAAGEEIEQPFGYDENDLNLDLFTNQMMRGEIVELLHTSGTNVRNKVSANSTIEQTVRDASMRRHHSDRAIAAQLPNGGPDGQKVAPGSVPFVVADSHTAQPNSGATNALLSAGAVGGAIPVTVMAPPVMSAPPASSAPPPAPPPAH